MEDWGAAAFGAVIGWYLYFINRYRKADVQIGDLTTVIGAIGGGAVLAIFKQPELFGSYGAGLAAGFFGYFLVLIFLVGHSKSFTSDWFLDGRRPNPPQDWGYGADTQQSVHTMAAYKDEGVAPGGTQNFYISPAPVGGQFVAPAQMANRRPGVGGEKVETPMVGS